MAQNQPLYRSIAESLRAQIRDGDLVPGEKLPTEADLSDKYKASRNTVREAIRRLTDEGLLESRLGQGTYVTRKIDPLVTLLTADPETGFGGGDGAQYLSQVRERHREPTNSVPKVEVLEVKGERAFIASRLGIPVGSQVVSRAQERLIDGIPWSLQTSYYLWDYIEKGATKLLMAQNIEEGTVRYLADTIGVRQAAYRDWITGRLASESEQTFFGIGHNAFVFAVSRVAYDQEEKPMRLTVTIYPADRNQFIVEVGRNLPDL